MFALPATLLNIGAATLTIFKRRYVKATLVFKHVIAHFPNFFPNRAQSHVLQKIAIEHPTMSTFGYKLGKVAL
ncbi:hypothetical protein [Corynebacterium sp. c25Ua_89]|uniref:hypothetical protein n=1 Tax=Corynebacterium sp. c25Ua_89 TaxID=3032356 RepID=UPI0039C2C907